MIVPKTALIATTASEAKNVSSIAATACSEETASQKLCQPSSNDRDTTAAIGSSTMIDR